MKKLYIFVPILTVCLILYTTVAPLADISEDISGKVLRLHILANSDSSEDQALKLQVRDGVLNAARELFGDCHTLTEAVESAKTHTHQLQAVAEDVINRAGYAYQVVVDVCKEFYNTRSYEDFSLPSGVYESIKIIIGRGEGHNWWCVMFPSVCLSGCTEDFEQTLTEEELDFIRDNRYIVKFKIVEIVEKLKEVFS